VAAARHGRRQQAHSRPRARDGGPGRREVRVSLPVYTKFARSGTCIVCSLSPFSRARFPLLSSLPSIFRSHSLTFSLSLSLSHTHTHTFFFVVLFPSLIFVNCRVCLGLFRLLSNSLVSRFVVLRWPLLLSPSLPPPPPPLLLLLLPSVCLQ
jgi:hypothetical protein